MAAYKDYYQILGLGKSADKQEIRRAFRKLAAQYHPDKNPDDASAEEKFKEINEAYTVLSDDEKRKFYDMYGTTEGRPSFGGFGGQPFGGSTSGDFSDFFQTLFGAGFPQSGSTRFGGADPFQSLPKDAEGTLNVSLQEAYHGASTPISIRDRRIDVTLPKGSKDGGRLRLRGQAPSGGDLYLTIKFKADETFSLEQDNIRVIVDVPDYVAVLGGPVRVPTLDGDVEMTLPAGTQAGKVLRLKGQGWPKKDGTRGDELVEIRVAIPEQLSDEQKALYSKLRELSEQEAVVSA